MLELATDLGRKGFSRETIAASESKVMTLMRLDKYDRHGDQINARRIVHNK